MREAQGTAGEALQEAGGLSAKKAAKRLDRAAQDILRRLSKFKEESSVYADLSRELEAAREKADGAATAEERLEVLSTALTALREPRNLERIEAELAKLKEGREEAAEAREEEDKKKWAAAEAAAKKLGLPDGEKLLKAKAWEWAKDPYGELEVALGLLKVFPPQWQGRPELAKLHKKLVAAVKNDLGPAATVLGMPKDLERVKKLLKELGSGMDEETAMPLLAGLEGFLLEHHALYWDQVPAAPAAELGSLAGDVLGRDWPTPDYQSKFAKLASALDDLSRKEDQAANGPCEGLGEVQEGYRQAEAGARERQRDAERRQTYATNARERGEANFDRNVAARQQDALSMGRANAAAQCAEAKRREAARLRGLRYDLWKEQMGRYEDMIAKARRGAFADSSFALNLDEAVAFCEWGIRSGYDHVTRSSQSPGKWDEVGAMRQLEIEAELVKYEGRHMPSMFSYEWAKALEEKAASGHKPSAAEAARYSKIAGAILRFDPRAARP